MKVFAIIGIIATVGVCLVAIWCLFHVIRQAILLQRKRKKIKADMLFVKHIPPPPPKSARTLFVSCFGRQQDGEYAVEMTNEEWEKKRDENAEKKFD